MDYLVETSVIVRVYDTGHAQSPVAIRALTELRVRGERLCLMPQNLYEFYFVSVRASGKRPLGENGLGMSHAEAQRNLAELERDFFLLTDPPEVYTNWKMLMGVYSYIKNGHDSRLAAGMLTHGLSHLLTFNTNHFKDYPFITVVDPGAVASL